MKILNVFENGSIGFATAIALTDVKSYLSLLVICIQAILILAKVIVFIVNCAKKKTTENIVVQIAQAVNELDNLKGEISESN